MNAEHYRKYFVEPQQFDAFRGFRPPIFDQFRGAVNFRKPGSLVPYACTAVQLLSQRPQRLFTSNVRPIRSGL